MHLDDTKCLKTAQETLRGMITMSRDSQVKDKHESDKLAMTLLPPSPPLYGYSAMKTTGDGNRLYNAGVANPDRQDVP